MNIKELNEKLNIAIKNKEYANKVEITGYSQHRTNRYRVTIFDVVLQGYGDQGFEINLNTFNLEDIISELIDQLDGNWINGNWY